MRTGLNIIKTDVDKTDVVITYLELTRDGLITTDKRLYELNDEDLSITNYTNNKTHYFNNPNDYIKIYNTVNQIVVMNGSINMLNELCKRFVGDILWKR